MSPLPPPISKDTPVGLSHEAFTVLEVVARHLSRNYPVSVDWIADKRCREWMELRGVFLELEPVGHMPEQPQPGDPQPDDAAKYLARFGGRTLRLTLIGVAALTWLTSANADERKAARRDYRRLVRESRPDLAALSEDELAAREWELILEAKRLEAEIRDTFVELAPLLAKGRAQLEALEEE